MSFKGSKTWTHRDAAAVENAIRRGATRRDLLKMLAATGMSAAMAGPIVVSATRAHAATPVSGGYLIGAGWSSSTADTLDPAKAALSTDYVRICAFYNRLTFLDENGIVQMELAESVESTDAQTWTVKLKKGVEFHDGHVLNADDVVYSLSRHLDPAVGSKVNAVAKQMIEISRVDATTVKIVLTEPNADLPTILAMHHFMMLVDGTTDFTTANGTGPFTCESFEPGVKSVSLRNENYFKGTGPYIEGFDYFAISDNSARINALLSGDIHIAASIHPRSLRLLEGKPHVATSITNSGSYNNLNIRLDTDPGAKDGFVQGMKHLMDRELIRKSVLRGLGDIANDQPISPSNRYYNPNLAPAEHDPEKAKFLFEKAGLLGTKIPIITSEAGYSFNDMALMMQQAGSKIGMDFDVQRVPADGYWSNYWLKSPVHFGSISARPTPDILFSLLYASDAAWNESHYHSEAFDKRMVEARATLDENLRTEIYWDMQEMISKEAGTLIPAYLSTVDAISSKLKGLKPNPLGGQMGYAFAEYVWFDG